MNRPFLLLLAVLAPSLAMAQGIQYEPDPPTSWMLPYQMRASPLLSKYLASSTSIAAEYGTASWAGLGTPTIDCVAAASGGNLTCTGATFSKQGAPTTTTSPYYYGGAAIPAVKLDGAADYWDAGDAGSQAGDFTVCAIFASDTIAAGLGYVVARDSGVDTGRQWGLFRSAANAQMIVWKTGLPPVFTNSTAVTVAVSGWNVGCWSYDYVADGSSIIRSNVNGVAPAEVTNALGPPQPGSSALRIGARGDGSYWTGKEAHVSVFTGTAFTAAQLAYAVRAMQSALGTKAEVVTVANAAAEWVVSADGTKEYLIPANTPRVVPGAGYAIYGANSSRIARNQRDSTNTANGGICGTVTSNWVKEANAVCAAGAVASPDGTTTAERITVGTAAGTAQIYQAPNGFSNSVSLAAAVWVKRVDVAGTLRIASTAGSGRWDVNLANLPDAWTRLTPSSPYVTVVTPHTSSGTGTGGLVFLTGSGTVQFDVWRPWLMDNSSVPGPDFEIQASVPGSRSATVQSVVNPVGATPVPFSVAVAATAPWGTKAVSLWSMGAGDNYLSLYLSAGQTLILVSNDASSAARSWSKVISLTAGTRHTFGAAYANDGTARLSLDGVELSGLTTGGAGTGILSALEATVTMGNGSGGYLDGTMAPLAICRGTNPVACERQVQ